MFFTENCQNYDILFKFTFPFQWLHLAPKQAIPPLQWLNARLQYLQCISTGDTAIFHLTIILQLVCQRPINHPIISSHDASLIPLTLPDLFLELPVAKQPGLGEDPFLDSAIMAKIGSVANKWVTYGHWFQRGHSTFAYSCLHYSDPGNNIKIFYHWTLSNYGRVK